MLCQFTFKNYKSYKDETVFDMQATNIHEFEESLLTFDKDKKRLLPVSVFYGPNGGGKSNVLEALTNLANTVMVPKLQMNSNYRPFVNEKLLTWHKPYLFDKESVHEPVEYEIFFRDISYEYRYNVSLYRNQVEEEYLYRLKIGGKKPAMIFGRYQGKIEIGSELKSAKVSTDVSKEILYLAFLGTLYNIKVINEVMNCFLKVEHFKFGDRGFEKALEKKNNFNDNRVMALVIKMLQQLDIKIIDFRLDENKNLYTIREVEGNIVELPLSEESDGTIKLFYTLPWLIEYLENGSVVVIDELDTKLHPKLLRYIISLFTDKNINKNGAQLIFTAHDISIMKSNIFRRDEIWFAAKDENEVSQIYSLYDIRDENNDHIRTTAAFDKQYMEGRYGADPYLRKMLSWEEDVNE